MDLINFIKMAFLFMTVIGAAVWLGMIWEAEGEDELKQSCYPIEWVTDTMHHTIAALIGREPIWTMKTQKYLMEGCYYFTRRISLAFDGKSPDPVTGTYPAGGIRME